MGRSSSRTLEGRVWVCAIFQIFFAATEAEEETTAASAQELLTQGAEAIVNAIVRVIVTDATKVKKC